MVSLYEDDVEEVLNNATALDYFKQWIRLVGRETARNGTVQDPNRPEEAADLYFALRGFGNYLRSPDAAARAQIIHRRYIRWVGGRAAEQTEIQPTERLLRLHSEGDPPGDVQPNPRPQVEHPRPGDAF